MKSKKRNFFKKNMTFLVIDFEARYDWITLQIIGQYNPNSKGLLQSWPLVVTQSFVFHSLALVSDSGGSFIVNLNGTVTTPTWRVKHISPVWTYSIYTSTTHNIWSWAKLSG